MDQAVAFWGEDSRNEGNVGWKGLPVKKPAPTQDIINPKQIVGIDHDSAFLLQDGTVDMAGGNMYAQLCCGDFLEHDGLKKALKLAGVKKLSGDGAHMMALLDDGTVRTWAGSFFGELGNGVQTEGREEPRKGCSPVPVDPGLKGVSDICSYGASNAVIIDGRIMAWGAGYQFQLGNGLPGIMALPSWAHFMPSDCERITGGGLAASGSLYAILEYGRVARVGGNANGQLLDGTTVKKSSPVISDLGVGGIKEIVARGSSVYVLNDAGVLFGGGGNPHGQLGVDPELESHTTHLRILAFDVKQVAAGLGFVLILKNDGSVHAMGDNTFGQLGDDTQISRHDLQVVSGLFNVEGIAAGSHHSFAILPQTNQPRPVIWASKGQQGEVNLHWESDPIPSNHYWHAASRPNRKYAWTWLPPIPALAREATFKGLLSGATDEFCVQTLEWDKKTVTMQVP